MSYTKQGPFVDKKLPDLSPNPAFDPAVNPAVDAVVLNAMDQGIADAHSGLAGKLDFGVLSGGRSGALTVAAGVSRLPVPFAMTLVSVRAAVGTAPTGAAVIVDVHKNGTTIFTTQANRPTIPAAGFVSPAAVPDVTSLVAGDYLTVDVDQIGSTVAGADLTWAIEYQAA